MKCSKIISILALLAVVFTALYPGGISFAAEEGAADGHYLVQRYSSVEGLKVKKKGSAYRIAFRHREEDIELTAEFYALEGAALYEEKAVGNVLSSNKDVLYLAVSDSIGPLDGADQEVGKKELFLRVVLLDADTGQISDIGLFLKRSQYSALKKAWKNAAVIDTDHELYGKLLHSGLWMKSYLAENQAVPQEFAWEEAAPSDVQLSLEQSDILAYVSPAALLTPANAYGYGSWQEFGGGPVSFYIRDTFYTGDSYVTLLALFQVWITQTAREDGFYGISFEVERQGDYLVEVFPDKTVRVREAAANMAYLVTKGPSIGIELEEGFSTGYINLCSTSGKCLGSAGTKTGGFWKRAAALFYPAVSTLGSISDFFGSLLRAVTGSKQKEAEPNPYQLSAKFTPAANPDAYYVTCENNMYKRGSGLQADMYLEEHDASEALRIRCHFGLIAVGSGYRHDLMEDGSIKISFTR